MEEKAFQYSEEIKNLQHSVEQKRKVWALPLNPLRENTVFLAWWKWTLCLNSEKETL